MPALLRLSFRFLDPLYHGRADSGEPEWPPSPLRAYQALVAAAAHRWKLPQFEDYARPELVRLAALGRPDIVAPATRPARQAYRLYVPNNAADLVAAAWVRGDRDASIADHRTEKDIRPTHLAGGTVHYLYPLGGGVRPNMEVLGATARAVTHLGCGTDLAAGTAALVDEAEADNLAGERWRPVADGGTRLRVPTTDTLADLCRRHEAFLARLGPDGFRPVPPLTAFAVVGYDCPLARPDGPAAGPAFAAFELLDPAGEKRAAFHTARKARDVAAWVRNAVGQVCDGWPFDPPERFVHGHAAGGGQVKGADAGRRFLYLPVPTVERRGDRGHHVGAVRRVLVAAPADCREQVAWVRRRLPGQELVWDDKPVALLNLLPTSDWVLRQYTDPAAAWSTVTPVILPGYDDRDPRKAEALLRKAFIQAGVPPELVAAATALDWRAVGFRPGTDLAGRYARPDKLTGPAYHVRVAFPRPIRGPLAVGAGRYRGLGLFAAEAD